MNLSTATVIIAAFAGFMLPETSQAMSDDEAKIEALENSFTAAFNPHRSSGGRMLAA
jgi:hypothetical protein